MSNNKIFSFFNHIPKNKGMPIVNKMCYISLLIMLVPSIFISNEMILTNHLLVDFSNFYPISFSNIDNISNVALYKGLEYKAKLMFTFGFYLGLLLFIIVFWTVIKLYLYKFNIIKACSNIYIPVDIQNGLTIGRLINAIFFFSLLLLGLDYYYFGNIFEIDLETSKVYFFFQNEIGLYISSTLATSIFILFGSLIPRVLISLYLKLTKCR